LLAQSIHNDERLQYQRAERRAAMRRLPYLWRRRHRHWAKESAAQRSGLVVGRAEWLDIGEFLELFFEGGGFSF
jgi:hypothetical protein